MQKFKGATLFEYTTLFTHSAGSMLFLLLIKNYVLGMLQSFGGELNYFGAKDDTCHKDLLKYMKLQALNQQVTLEKSWKVETPLFD